MYLYTTDSVSLKRTGDPFNIRYSLFLKLLTFFKIMYKKICVKWCFMLNESLNNIKHPLILVKFILMLSIDFPAELFQLLGLHQLATLYYFIFVVIIIIIIIYFVDITQHTMNFGKLITL